MNICMFTNTYLPHVGGVAKSVALFSEDLINLGHRVLVIAPTFAEEITEDRPEEILRVPAIQNFNGSDFSAGFALPFLVSSKIKDFEPHIIHSHHPFLLGDAGLKMARRYNLPIVFTYHTRYEEYTHYVSLDSPQMRRFVINLSAEYANLCDGVIAPSRSIRHIIEERGVSVGIEEIPTGVDLDFFANGSGERFRQENDISHQVPIIGHVGRLAPEKNIPYLAEAVGLYLKKNDGIFLVVGTGESEKDILTIFKKMNLENRLVMTGVKNGPDLADAYCSMDVFVFASKSETQGMVLIEAMASGSPVIALDASGVREVLVNKKNGLLLKSEATPSEFALALENYMAGNSSNNRFKENAKMTAEKFSRKKCAEKLLSLYEVAIEKYRQNEKSPNGFEAWEKLLRSISVEWELISEKTAALVNSITTDS